MKSAIKTILIIIEAILIIFLTISVVFLYRGRDRAVETMGTADTVTDSEESVNVR